MMDLNILHCSMAQCRRVNFERYDSSTA